MVVSGGRMEAPVAIKWPGVIIGRERERERERERGFSAMRKKKGAFAF